MQLFVRGTKEVMEPVMLIDINGTPIDFTMTASYYNKSSNAIVTPKSASITNSVILAANVNRKGRPSIYYDDAAVMYLLLGDGVASSTNFTLKLGADYLTYYEPPTDNYTGPISAVWSAPVGNALITECL